MGAVDIMCLVYKVNVVAMRLSENSLHTGWNQMKKEFGLFANEI